MLYKQLGVTVKIAHSCQKRLCRNKSTILNTSAVVGFRDAQFVHRPFGNRFFTLLPTKACLVTVAHAINTQLLLSG